MSGERKFIDWKHKMFEVKKIDKPEILTHGGYWKKFQVAEIKLVVRKQDGKES